jgi:translation initiation factor 2 alpha subunit (eIF-2alpha)
MSKNNHASGMRDQIIAMHDASIGTLEAARRRYEMLKTQTEQVSINYVYGRAPRAMVRTVTEQFLAAESALNDAAARVRVNQKALDAMASRSRGHTSLAN